MKCKELFKMKNIRCLCYTETCTFRKAQGTRRNPCATKPQSMAHFRITTTTYGWRKNNFITNFALKCKS